MTDMNIWDYKPDDSILSDASLECPNEGRHYGNALSWYPDVNHIDVDAGTEIRWRRHCVGGA